MMNRQNFGRRTFLKYSSLSAISVLPTHQTLTGLFGTEAVVARKFIDASYRLINTSNLLSLELHFINVRKSSEGLIKGKYFRDGEVNDSTQSFMIVRLPQQHIAEEYFDLIQRHGDESATLHCSDGCDDGCQTQISTKQGRVYAETRIAGYSYLVFQIEWSRLKNQVLPVKTRNVLNWNAPYFRLKVRQNLGETIFSIKSFEACDPAGKDNSYPFGYDGTPSDCGMQPVTTYNQEKFPRAYSSANLLPSPITAIEAPYRLIVCPKLPDQDNYRFVWTIPTWKSLQQCHNLGQSSVELWMARLSIERLPKRKVGDQTQLLHDNQVQEVLNEGDDLMQLMIFGSPDYKGIDDSCSDELKNTLPKAEHRGDLVDLYIYSRITARTNKLLFTPLGISTDIYLKNTLSEVNKISLFEWKHSISFGRDQEVKISELVVDACFGLKMLHVYTTRRRTVCGVALLDYREFIVPLDIEKDYTLYNTKTGAGKYKNENYKCNTPFKKVRFADLDPKRVIPITENDSNAITRTIEVLEQGQIQRQSKKLAYWPRIVSGDFLEWKFIGTDWHGNEIEFSKKIYLLSADLANTSLTEKLGSKINDEEITAVGKVKSEIEAVLKLESLPAADLVTLFDKIDKEFRTATTSEPDIWVQIERLGEKYDLEQLEYYRSLFEKLLADIEKTLRQEARNIEDLLIDEFNVFKNRLLDFENTILGKIHRAVGGYKSIYKSLEELIVYVPVGASRIGYEDKVKEIKSRLQSIVRNQELIIQNNLNDAGTAILAMINQQVAELAESAKGFMTPFDGYTIPAEVRNWVDDIKAKAADVQAFVERLSGEELVGIFRHEYDRFLARIPGRLRGIIDTQLAKYRNVFNRCLAGIRNREQEAKGRIDLFKNEIGYAVNELDSELEQMKTRLKDIFKEKWEDEFEKFKKLFYEKQAAISRLKTDFILYRNNFRRKIENDGKQLLDFFNEYACYPQLQTAQVYINRVNDLVNKEIPLKIQYAEDYFKNQVDDFVLETKQNAAQVFAQVKSDAKELLKGAMHEIGNELGGIVNPELAADFLTYAKDARNNVKQVVDSFQDIGDDIKDRVDQFKNDLDDITEQFMDYRDQMKEELERTKNDLILLGKEAKENLEQFRTTAEMEAKKYFKGLEAKIMGSIHLRDILGDGFELPKLDRKGNKLVYQFLTGNIKPVTLGPFSFKNFTSKGTSCALSVYFEKPLTEPEKYFSWTRLNNFRIGVFDERLIIDFDRLEIYSSNEVKNKITVSIGDVFFQKELAFLQALSQNIKVPGTGISLNISPKEVRATYAYTFPSISGGAFTMDNLKFNVGVAIPLPFGKSSKMPIVTRFGINGPDDKFVVAAGIWGGRGHFVIEATPKYINLIDTSIEFGGYLGLNLGIARGEAFLMVGIRFVYQRDDLGEVSYDFYAYLTCGGSVTVFGFITVSVLFLLCMRYQAYQNRSSLYGTASVSYSVKIGFFSKSFTLTYTKRIKGTDSEGGANDLSTVPQRNEYRVIHVANTDPGSHEPEQLLNFAQNIGNQERLDGRRTSYSSKEWKRFCESFRYVK